MSGIQQERNDDTVTSEQTVALMKESSTRPKRKEILYAIFILGLMFLFAIGYNRNMDRYDMLSIYLRGVVFGFIFISIFAFMHFLIDRIIDKQIDENGVDSLTDTHKTLYENRPIFGVIPAMLVSMTIIDFFRYSVSRYDYIVFGLGFFSSIFVFSFIFGSRIKTQKI